MSEVPDSKRSGTEGLQKTPTQCSVSQGPLFPFNKYSHSGEGNVNFFILGNYGIDCSGL